MSKEKRKTSNIVPIRDGSHPKIDKGIPVPSRTSAFSFIQKMEVGDSFYLSSKQYNVKTAVNSARSAAYSFDMSLTARADHGGVRIWRVS